MIVVILFFKQMRKFSFYRVFYTFFNDFNFAAPFFWGKGGNYAKKSKMLNFKRDNFLKY